MNRDAVSAIHDLGHLADRFRRLVKDEDAFDVTAADAAALLRGIEVLSSALSEVVDAASFVTESPTGRVRRSLRASEVERALRVVMNETHRLRQARGL